MIGDLREIRLVLNDDGTADLFVTTEDRKHNMRTCLRRFSEDEEIGDLRQYTDESTNIPAGFRGWPIIRVSAGNKRRRAAA